MKIEDLENLIKEIITQTENDEISLSQALTKSKRIIKKLNHSELDQFVKNELEGKFPDNNIPEYRKYIAEPIGIFQNKYNGQTQCVTLNFEQFIEQSGIDRDLIYVKNIDSPVPAMEDYLQKTETKEFYIEFTSGQLEIVRKYLQQDANGGWLLKSGKFKLPFSAFTEILFKIKSRFIDILLNIEDEISEPSLQKRESFYEKGRPFDALMELTKIISTAKKEIVLIDAYVDDKTLDFFSSKKSHINIKILTNKKSLNPSFKLLIDSFNSQYQNLEVKHSNNFHDRFIIIDRVYYYHIGASIKDAGKSTFMFTKVEEPDMTKAIQNAFDLEWGK